jgi:large subunit ribosomal protein L23
MVSVKSMTQSLYDVIRFSYITLKAKELNEKLGKVVILVCKDANKVEIKAAVEAIFGMKVESVNTMINRGKTKISARRYTYYKSDFKKAIITFRDKNFSQQLSSSMDSAVNVVAEEKKSNQDSSTQQ